MLANEPNNKPDFNGYVECNHHRHIVQDDVGHLYRHIDAHNDAGVVKLSLLCVQQFCSAAPVTL